MKKIFVFSFLFLLGFLVYYFYPEQPLPKDSKIDAMIVYKSKHQLLAFSKGKLIKTYTISLGRNPVGAKEYEGDQKLLKERILSMIKIRIVVGIKT